MDSDKVKPAVRPGGASGVRRVSAKLINLICALTLITSMLPLQALAQSPKAETMDAAALAAKQLEGSGTRSDPYLVRSAQDLRQLAANVNSSNSSSSEYRYEGKFVKLAANIDLGGQSFTPIGSTNPGNSMKYTFKGDFDGNGKSIVGLNIANTSNITCGLFGAIDGARLHDFTVSGSITTSYSGAGGVVGCAFGESTIENVGNNVDVITSSTNAGSFGGIVGQAVGKLAVSGCFNSGTIQAGGMNACGIVGWLGDGSEGTTISDSYNKGGISAQNAAAGICSTIQTDPGLYTVENCYNIGSTTVASGRKYSEAGIYVAGTSPSMAAAVTSRNCYWLIGFSNAGAGYNSGSQETAPATDATKSISGPDDLKASMLGSAFTDTPSSAPQLKWQAGSAEAKSFAVTYDGNGATAGTVPVDAKRYEEGALVTLPDNVGNLERTGHRFSGWSIDGVLHKPGASFTMPGCDVVVKAEWLNLKPPYSGGAGTAADPYLISSTDDIATMVGLIDAGDDLAANHYKLTESLSYPSENSWQPIGTDAVPFAGDFDGDGHSITVNCTDGSKSRLGVFGVVKGASSESPARIEGLTVKGTLKGNYVVGGIAGLAQNAEVSRCRNEAEVSAYAIAGGIVATADDITSSYILADSMSYLAIDRCANAGAVSATRTSNYAIAGGIAGAFGATAKASKITNCYNAGAIFGAPGSYRLGGIAGFWCKSSEASRSAAMENCFNAGPVGTANNNSIGQNNARNASLVGTVDSIAFSVKSTDTIRNCYALENTDLDLWRNGSTGSDEQGTINSFIGAWKTNVSFDGADSDAPYAYFLTEGEMRASGFASRLGEAFTVAQNAIAVLLWESPCTPWVGDVAVSGLDDKGNVSAGATVHLSVDAAPPAGEGAKGELSYDWRRSLTGVPQADDPTVARTRDADVTEASPGTFYYYCIVTNTVGSQIGTFTSEAVAVNYTSDADAAEPRIIRQPTGIDDAEQDVVAPSLSVQAEVAGEGAGVLSYQWYAGKDPDTETGDDEAIEGATQPDFIPSTEYAGTYYYYCVVTNTFEQTKHAESRSDIVTVRVSNGKIRSVEDLVALAQRVNGEIDYQGNIQVPGNDCTGKTYELACDLDLSSIENWIPIGYSTYYRSKYIMREAPFKGTFDGCGHTISGLSITEDTRLNRAMGELGDFGKLGLFGYLEDARIMNLTVSGTITAQSYYVGGIAGQASGFTEITACGFAGSIGSAIADAAGQASHVGGILGKAESSYSGIDNQYFTSFTLIQDCFNKANIDGSSYLGGIVGSAADTAIRHCYNTGSIRGNTGYCYVGGLAGEDPNTPSGGSLQISDSFNAGALSAATSTGFVGALTSQYLQSCTNSFYIEGCADYAYQIYDSENRVVGSVVDGGWSRSDMMGSAFVAALNRSSAYYRQNALMDFPQLSWEPAVSAQTLEITLKPADALTTAQAALTDSAGREWEGIETDRDDGAGAITSRIYTFRVPASEPSAYVFTAKAFGYAEQTMDIPVSAVAAGEATSPIKREMTLTQTARHGVTFEFSGLASADAAADARLWLATSDYGQLHRGTLNESLSLSTLQLPAASYTFGWVADGFQAVRGEFTVSDGAITQSVAFVEPSVWDGTRIEPLQDADGICAITSAPELAGFADLVNTQPQSPHHGELLCDLTLNSTDDLNGRSPHSWEPIGISENQAFHGSFAGNSHVIEGLYIDSVAGDVGLFGSLAGDTDPASTTCIENLVATGMVSSSADNVGGLIGSVSDSNVSLVNCGFDGYVTGRSFVGGLIGGAMEETMKLEISNCFNRAAVSATMAQNYEAGYAGGLVGCMRNRNSAVNGIIIDKCYNSGSVHADSYAAGGLLGAGSATISNSFNLGTVAQSGTHEAYLNAHGAILGMYSSSALMYIGAKVSYLKGCADIAFGYVSDVAPCHANELAAAKNFLEAYRSVEGFVCADAGFSADHNSGFPYLSWENTSREYEQIPLPKGSKDNPYRIADADDMVNLRTNVMEGRTYAGSYFILENDVDMTGVEFGSIGTYYNGGDTSRYFGGVFQGEGHAITGLSIIEHSTASITMNDFRGSGTGLFGYTRNARICDLEVSGQVEGEEWVGGIVGYAYCTSIDDCISHMQVTCDFQKSNTNTGNYVGGIAGQSYTGGQNTTGGIRGCLFDGTVSHLNETRTGTPVRWGAIASLGSSSSTLTACYYLQSPTLSQATERDAGQKGIHGVDTFASDEIAWKLNTWDETRLNALKWGNDAAGSGVVFASDKAPAVHRIMLDTSKGDLSIVEGGEYVAPGKTVTIQLGELSKGYACSGPFEALGFNEETGLWDRPVDRDERDTWKQSPYSWTLTSVSCDVVVRIPLTFDEATTFSIEASALSTDDLNRNATIDLMAESGEPISAAHRGDRITLRIDGFDNASQFAGIKAESVYGNGRTSDLALETTAWGREYTFTMADADARIQVLLEQLGTEPASFAPSQEVAARAFHTANAAYAGDGSYMGWDFIVDDDGTTGITDYAVYAQRYRVQAIDFLEDIEYYSSKEADYYHQLYSVRNDDGSVEQHDFNGIPVQNYLVYCGMDESRVSADTPVTFYGKDGSSLTLAYGDLTGKAYNAYYTQGTYAGEIALRGLPVLLATGEGYVTNSETNEDDAWAYAFDQGGPLKLVRGQQSADDVNPIFENLVKIVVGDPAKATTAQHVGSYSDDAGDSISIDVYRSGQFMKSVSVTMAEMEALMSQGAALGSAYESGYFNGLRLGLGGAVQNYHLVGDDGYTYTAWESEQDHYQGASIWDLICEKAGVTIADAAAGKATFYEEPYLGTSPVQLQTVSLAYLAGGTGAQGDYSGNSTPFSDGFETFARQDCVPFVATAKNGAPIVSDASSGAIDGLYNYRGPFICIMPYNESEPGLTYYNLNANTGYGDTSYPYFYTYFHGIRLDLGEAADKTALKELVAVARIDASGVAASTDGAGLAKGREYAAPALVAELNAAMSAADAIIDDATASQQKVDAAYARLVKALDALDAGRKTATGSTSASAPTSANLTSQTIKATPTVKLAYTAKTYTGRALKPAITVTVKGKKLTSKYYTVTYKNNKAVGKATVTVKLRSGYSGSKSATFKINPKATAITKLTQAKGAFTVKWRKQATQTTGYQIRYSTAKSMKGAKTVTIAKKKTISKKISKLKAGKRYYVQVRTYKKVGKTKYYSAWSKAKSVVTRK